MTAVSCDYCSKQFEKKMFCCAKCRVYAFRNAKVTNPLITVTPTLQPEPEYVSEE